MSLHPSYRRADPAVLADVARASLESALVEGDELRAEAAAQLLLETSCTLSELYSDIIQPLHDDVGHRWEVGDLSIADEHLVTSATRGLISRLRAYRTPRPRRAGRVVLCPVVREEHVLGLAMLEHVLLDAGWKVSVLDPMPTGELAHVVGRYGDVRIVGFSLHNTADRHRLAREVHAVRADVPGVPVMVGGLAVRTDPELPRRLGVDGGAGSLQAALALVDTLTNPLTLREREVLAGVSEGRSNAEIGEALGIGGSTVKSHLERVYLKTGRRDRAAAVAEALRRGWLG